jgi:hypothetical protein
MSATLAKALKVRFPNDLTRNSGATTATPNDFGVQPLSSTSTHAATALPLNWAGRFLLIYIPTGGVDIWFASSKLATAEVDRTVAPSTTFPALKAGFPLSAGQVHQLLLPAVDHNETLYLCYESASTQTFYVAIGDAA